MANFAREQLTKYGWTEGKGLGKNENGITEPVRLATNQNKAGIGHDGTEPWWEKLFDDATKNVKVESQDGGVSLSVVDDTGPLAFGNDELRRSIWPRERSVLQNNYKKFVKPEDVFTRACASNWDAMSSGKITMHRTMEPDPTLGGKSERIAEQDRILLNESLSDTARKNDTVHIVWKTNVESDVEQTEYEMEMDNNQDTLQSKEEEEEQTYETKSIRKEIENRRKINELVKQLDTCNLEKNNDSDFLKLKGSQKMKKSKDIYRKVKIYRRGLESKKLLERIFRENNKDELDMSSFKNQRRLFDRYLSEFIKIRSRELKNLEVSELQCNNEKYNVEHKIELSSELRNSIEENR